MKQLIIFLAIVTAIPVFAQQVEEPEADTKGKFRKENMFIGGGLNLGAGSGMFAIGVLPEVGYSVTKWLDAGVSFNLNYQTMREDDYWTGATYARNRYFNYGTGVFLRIWPVKFLHLTVQPEYNWINVSRQLTSTGQKERRTLHAESLLVGIGYGSREIGNQLSYFTLMIDVAQNINSPYRDQYNRADPVFRTGIGFYLGRRR
ncbi:MAG TPA: hypothetical protein VF145_07275 [Chitinophagaceae bacterium]